MAAAAVAAPAAPAMLTGLIKKEGHMIKNWKERHFVLLATPAGSTLTYFEKAKNEPPFGEGEKGSVSLKGSTMKRTGNFIVITDASGSELKLDFTKPTEKEKWAQAINAHLTYSNTV